MALTPLAESEPARRMAIAGAAIELAVVHQVEGDPSIVAEPYHEGRAGDFMPAAKACTALGARPGRRSAGVGGWGAFCPGCLLAAGSLLTRFGVFDAGMASARDPKYTVIPQRERMAARSG